MVAYQENRTEETDKNKNLEFEITPWHAAYKWAQHEDFPAPHIVVNDLVTSDEKGQL